MKVLIETHGCKLNMADSQSLAGQFMEAGFGVAGKGESPDVYVLNSCTVTQVADRKARRALSKARRTYPDAVIVAAGCYPARVEAEVDALSSVDMVVPNKAKHELVQLVMERVGEYPDALHVPPQASPANSPLGRSRASVKIQEGCDQVCAYCIVPKVRGRERSIPVETIVHQVNSLAEKGCLEVVLTGTQLGTYGFDLDEASLPSLVRAILARTEIPRLRISSLQPLEITDELLAIWSDEGLGRLCPHFHIPLQSGSNGMLAKMRRRYDRDQFMKSLGRVRAAVPDCSITTDIIAGFPGETEADHADTLGIVQKAEFADCHVFPYSQRPGTTAAHMSGHVDPQARADRAAELRQAGAAHARAHRRTFVGSTRPVLWEGPLLGSGLTDNYLRVTRQGRGEAVNESVVGQLEDVQLVGIDSAGDLVGESVRK